MSDLEIGVMKRLQLQHCEEGLFHRWVTQSVKLTTSYLELGNMRADATLTSYSDHFIADDHIHKT